MTDSNARACERCKGEGKIPDILNEAQMVPCRYCDGTGFFFAPDLAAIRAACFTTRGKKAFRSSMSSRGAFSSKDLARAYYVWRMARFHGGADMTLPFTAPIAVKNDPFIPELDKLADEIATEVFGSNLNAARRWSRAFGY